VQEQQRQTAVLLEAINSLQGAPAGDAAAPVAATVAAGDLVATAKGSMAHRPDCAVVTGKRGLRNVSERDGLTPCRLCNPY
jgi:hypothetical protein